MERKTVREQEREKNASRFNVNYSILNRFNLVRMEFPLRQQFRVSHSCFSHRFHFDMETVCVWVSRHTWVATFFFVPFDTILPVSFSFQIFNWSLMRKLFKFITQLFRHYFSFFTLFPVCCRFDFLELRCFISLLERFVNVLLCFFPLRQLHRPARDLVWCVTNKHFLAVEWSEYASWFEKSFRFFWRVANDKNRKPEQTERIECERNPAKNCRESNIEIFMAQLSDDVCFGVVTIYRFGAEWWKCGVL